MRVAVKCEEYLIGGAVTLDADGMIEGADSGTTLLRRILGLFENPILASSTAKAVTKHPWGEIWPVSKIDCNGTVVINMDVMDAFSLYTRLKLTPRFHHPKIVNFAWWNVPEFSDQNLIAGFAAACATFPLFGNSPKVIADVQEVVRAQTGLRGLTRMRTASALLGVDTEKVSTVRRVDPDAPPIVQYPAMFSNGRKNPELFIRIVSRVRAVMELQVRMRLHRSQIKAPVLDPFRDLDWADVTLVPASKAEYYRLMEEETAFLSCSKDESYGIGYVEGLYAGLVGVFLDRPWVHQIVPAGYPFLFGSEEEGAAMLLAVLRDPEQARAMVDASAGGSMQAWIREHHNAATFDAAVVAMVDEFFPERVK